LLHPTSPPLSTSSLASQSSSAATAAANDSISIPLAKKGGSGSSSGSGGGKSNGTYHGTPGAFLSESQEPPYVPTSAAQAPLPLSFLHAAIEMGRPELVDTFVRTRPLQPEPARRRQRQQHFDLPGGWVNKRGENPSHLPMTVP
jgi:hypothetical protein